VLLQLTRGADDLQRRVDMVRGASASAPVGTLHSCPHMLRCLCCTHAPHAHAPLASRPVSLPLPPCRRSPTLLQVRAMTDLVILMRQHVRKFLPDLLSLVNDFWTG